jgi:hypothetical protein
MAVRFSLLLPASAAKKAAPILAKKAITIVDVGPSVILRRYINAKHPIAAPAKSTAYSLLTCRVNLVKAKQTHIPLKTKGTDITAYVNVIEYKPTRVTPWSNGTKGIHRCVRKLRTMDIENNKELRAR